MIPPMPPQVVQRPVPAQNGQVSSIAAYEGAGAETPKKIIKDNKAVNRDIFMREIENSSSDESSASEIRTME
jgi:hypothetical protein